MNLKYYNRYRTTGILRKDFRQKGVKVVTIKEVSEKYGLSGDTLRYYERVGMIPPVTRTAGGIRDYGPGVIFF